MGDGWHGDPERGCGMMLAVLAIAVLWAVGLFALWYLSGLSQLGVPR